MGLEVVCVMLDGHEDLVLIEVEGSGLVSWNSRKLFLSGTPALSLALRY